MFPTTSANLVDASVDDMKRASRLIAGLLAHTRSVLGAKRKLNVGNVIDPDFNQTRTFHGNIDDGIAEDEVQVDEFFSLLQKGIRGEIWLSRKLPTSLFRNELRSSRVVVREQSRGSPSYRRAVNQVSPIPIDRRAPSGLGVLGPPSNPARSRKGSTSAVYSASRKSSLAPVPGSPSPGGAVGVLNGRAELVKPRKSIVTSIVRNSEMFDTI